MQQLHDLEVLEIEVLEKLNSIKALDSLYFGGGTMLRLCHNLNRFSTDMDFWLGVETDPKAIYGRINKLLSANYQISDSYNKRNTMLFEFRSPGVHRNLKIEIRKVQSLPAEKSFKWERKIAFSKFSTKQVMLKGLTLDQMMKNKVGALLSRKLIRDAFDIEFLLMRGIELPSEKATLNSILQILNGFKDNDFKVILGSILEPRERKYYFENRFLLLKEEITKQLIGS